ncbi:MAG: hypothetical protein ACRESV_06820, partial [Nevskiales bacterium]
MNFLDFEIIQKLNKAHDFNLRVHEFRATLRNEVLLVHSAISATVSSATITAPAVSAGIAAATALAATAHATGATAASAATLPLALPLPREGIRTDIAKGSFHGIRLGATGTSIAPVAAVIT